MFFNKKREKQSVEELLSYSFIDNSILLTTDTIQKNGFYEVWRQQNDEKSIQILCFNEKTGEFKAFDRFHWMEETTEIVWEGVPYQFKEKDLWTPIRLHYTEEWLKEHLISTIN